MGESLIYPCENPENPNCDDSFCMVFAADFTPSKNYHKCTGQRKGAPTMKILQFAMDAFIGQSNSLVEDFKCGAGRVTYDMTFRPLVKGGFIIEGEAIGFKKTP